MQSLESEEQRRIVIGQTLDPGRQTLDSTVERRQLTVTFYDNVPVRPIPADDPAAERAEEVSQRSRQIEVAPGP